MSNTRHRATWTILAALTTGALAAWPPPAAAQSGNAQAGELLEEMVQQQHQFKPDALHSLGEAGLTIVLDELLPETAKPKQVEMPREEIEKLIEQLGDENFRRRALAADRLRQLGPGAKTTLVKATRHPDPDVSWRAAQILRKWASAKDEDKSRYLPAFAVYSAGIRDDARLRELCRRVATAADTGLINRGRSSILQQCVMTIVRAGSDDYTNELKPLLDHPDEQVVEVIVRAAGQSVAFASEDGYYPELLLDAMRSDRQRVAAAALAYADRCRDEALRPVVKGLLIDLFERDDHDLQFLASGPLMVGFDYEPARDYILEQAGDYDLSTRYRALSRLSDTRLRGRKIDRKTLDALLPLMEKDDSTRRMAVRALGNHAGGEVIDVLIPLLNDKSSSVRQEAQRVLPMQTDTALLRRKLQAAATGHAEVGVRVAATSMLEEVKAEEEERSSEATRAAPVLLE